MNKYNAKDYLPLVQALAEGKTIQFKANQWEDIPCNSEFKWNNCPRHYRIKPEPRTFVMWLHKDSDYFRDSEPPFEPNSKTIDINGCEWERITVQEVLK